MLEWIARPSLCQPPKVRRHRVFGNEPRFDLRSHLYRIFGVDLTEVPGMSILTAHTLLAEVGPDLSRFPDVSAFSSWLGLCLDNDITGGKKVAAGNRHVNNRAACIANAGIAVVVFSRR